MNYTLLNSVCLINSASPELHRSFGTGFVVHRYNQTSYVLTCAHVVKAVGGQAEIKVDGLPASVVASGQEIGVDLAVLQVRDLSVSKLQFKLHPPQQKGQAVLISGFYEFDKRPRGRELIGALGDSTTLPICDGLDSIRLWDLQIQQDDFFLQHGYSGSPVVATQGDYVVGVVSHAVNGGTMGAVISIDALQKFWTEIPPNLIKILEVPMSQFPQTPSPYTNRLTEWLKNDLQEIEQEIERLRRKREDLLREISAIDRELATASGPERIRLDRLREQQAQERQSDANTLKELEKQYLEIEAEIKRRQNQVTVETNSL